jgi:glycosyltransferase involved in cell wall biosynthesis
MTISLNMICRDNEGTIGAALESAKDIFDEIVVVDTGSVDGTLDIVKKYTDKIFHQAWEDDFSKPRNFAIEKSTCDRIFWMDSDDILPQATRMGIGILKKEERRDVAVMFYLKNINNAKWAEKWLEIYPQFHLFTRDEKIRFRGKIHESVEVDIMSLAIEVRLVNLQIEHHGYQDLQKLENKIHRDIRMGSGIGGEVLQFRIDDYFFCFNERYLSMWISTSNCGVFAPNYPNAQLARVGCEKIEESNEQSRWMYIATTANRMIEEHKRQCVSLDELYERINSNLRGVELQPVSIGGSQA